MGDYFGTKSDFLVKLKNMTIGKLSFHWLLLHVVIKNYVKLIHTTQPLWQNRVYRLGQVGALGNCVSLDCLIANIKKGKTREKTISTDTSS